MSDLDSRAVTRPACPLSPYVLAELVDRFGGRAEPPDGARARFPLRDLRASARIQPERGGQAEVAVEVADLAIHGVGLRLHVPVQIGTVLTLDMRVPGVRSQTWRCRVVNIYGFDGTRYHVGATFEAIGDT